MKATLICTAGSLKGKAFELGEIEVSIGRSSLNTIVIEDLASPRRHLIIRPVNDGRYKLEDLGAKSGTFINDVRVLSRLLEPNDTIRIGRTVFEFRTWV